MMRRRYAAVGLLMFSLLTPGITFARRSAPTPTRHTGTQPQQPAQQPSPTPDPNDPIVRIKDEGMNRSKVMETLSYLSDVIGPRLTASPGMKRANEWTRDQLTKWGLQNAHLESWGPFGRGWTLKRFSAQVSEPQAIPLIAYPKAWSPGTQGTLTAEVVYVDARAEADLAKFAGQLKGKIVLTTPLREVPAHFEAQGTRRDEKNLLALADAPDPRLNPPRFGGGGRGGPQGAAFQFAGKKLQFFEKEGAALLIDPSRGDGGTIFVQSASVAAPVATDGAATTPPRALPPYDKNAKIMPQLVLAVEHYNRIVRMLQAAEKVKISVDLAVEWQDADLMGYNTVAEIPGTDLKDEVVMLGGHMDSWHSGTGATDNGAGVSVAMEALRILQTLNLKPRRTIRIALWTGEEQGLLGSRAYVAQHFGKYDPPATGGGGFGGPPPGSKLVTTPEYEKLAGYFNLDNGTGKVRGVYLQGNEAVRPLFRQWLMPFRDTGATTLSMSNTGGTDHLSFDGIGLPGFQFIQDEI